MKITFINQSTFNSLSNLSRPHDQGMVLTIGNFDGLHLGHQQMINTTLTLSEKTGLVSAVMIFEPMPKELFSPKTAPARLMNRLETQHIFANYRYQDKAVNQLIIADFNEQFRHLSALEFSQLLIETLNVKTVVIGDDFHFGHDRTGDGQFLRDAGLEVHIQNTISDTGQVQDRISSTRIRQLLQMGDLTQANALLGRDYCMLGKVQHGDKIGRTLNFPTANIALDRIKPSLKGVFAVDVQWLDDDGEVMINGWQDLASNDQTGICGLAENSLFGTANIGTRPTIDGEEWRLEVHFPDFQGDLYGKLLKVRFLHFLHGEHKYNGLEELKVGIANDVNELIAWRYSQA